MAIHMRLPPEIRGRRRRAWLGAAQLIGLLIAPQFCLAQALPPSQALLTNREVAAKSATEQPPLTDRERAELLQLIRQLQERVAKLESQISPSTTAPGAQVPPPTTAPDIKAQPPAAVSGVPTLLTGTGPEPASPPAEAAKDSTQIDERKGWGTYTPNLGFKVVDTEYGDLNISIYTYVRYLNQLGLDSTYTDAFGNTKNVQQRQDVQIQKLQMKFLGWMLTPKFRYFLYAWTSNANQGQGAQVVLAGNLNYTFNKYLTLSGGIRSLPGTRSVEGNFPFWPGVDSRMIADEFFRPSYTSGVWATGEITDKLKYQVMLGNNMSTLGVSAAQLDNGFNTFSSALVWTPTTGEYGQGFGDFEDHDRPAARLAAHFSRSDENKESQPSDEQFENTQLRLSDGSVIFTPNLFGPGVTITDATWKMSSLDAGLKYRGYALEGEYYWRRIDNFRGLNTTGLTSLFDHGFQFQGSAMVLPRSLQLYAGHSRVFGQYGKPWDFRAGLNWFPWKNKVVRWNTEGLWLQKSPVGYTSVPFAVGGRGFVFHSSLELAF